MPSKQALTKLSRFAHVFLVIMIHLSKKTGHLWFKIATVINPNQNRPVNTKLWYNVLLVFAENDNLWHMFCVYMPLFYHSDTIKSDRAMYC